MMQNCFNLETIFQSFKKKQTDIIYPKEDKLIQRALRCLEGRIKYHPEPLCNTAIVHNYVRLQLAQEQNEVFAILFLDNHHRVLAFEKLFFGTINSTAVYPRVVVQRALFHNAAAVILAHNHPSGSLEPSAADKNITQDIKMMLKYIDIKVLDHFIVSLKGTLSFAECGLI